MTTRCARPVRGILAAGGVFVFAWATIGAAPAAYPEKPIRLIVPVAPGGTSDIVARTLADEMSKSMGRTILVENRPGASSLVGTQFVAKSSPDGYTLLAASTTVLSAPAVIASPGYDPIRDFAPVSLAARAPMILVVNPGVPARTLNEFVALAKRHAGEVTNGSSGNGSAGHMAGELFARRTGVKFTNVFYKGSAQTIIDVIGGHVMVTFDQIGTSGPQIRAGKLRPIAVTTTARSPLFPKVPTIAESGYPGYEYASDNFMLAPAGTSRDIVVRLHAEMVKAWAPELVKRFAERAIDLISSASPDELAAYVKSEVEKFQRIVREANIKPE